MLIILGEGYIMDSGVIVGILALVGTIFGSIMGAVSMSKMLSYRISQLESKVNNLEGLPERVALLELKVANGDNYMKDGNE